MAVENSSELTKSVVSKLLCYNSDIARFVHAIQNMARSDFSKFEPLKPQYAMLRNEGWLYKHDRARKS